MPYDVRSGEWKRLSSRGTQPLPMPSLHPGADVASAARAPTGLERDGDRSAGRGQAARRGERSAELLNPTTIPPGCRGGWGQGYGTHRPAVAE